MAETFQRFESVDVALLLSSPTADRYSQNSACGSRFPKRNGNKKHNKETKNFKHHSSAYSLNYLNTHDDLKNEEFSDIVECDHNSNDHDNKVIMEIDNKNNTNLTNLMNENKTIQENLENVTMENGKLQSQISNLKEENQMLQESLNDISNKYNAKQAEYHVLNENFNVQCNELCMIKQFYEQCLKENNELHSELMQEKTKNQNLLKTNEANKQEIENLNMIKTQLLNQLVTINKKMNDLQLECETILHSNNETHNDLYIHQMHITNLQNESLELAQQLQQLSNDNIDLKHKIISLKQVNKQT